MSQQDDQNIVRALYDYQGTTDEELSFKKGQSLTILNNENEDWWYATTSDKQAEGYVPRNFVRYLHEDTGDNTFEEDAELDEIQEEDEDYEDEEYDDEEEYSDENDGETDEEEEDTVDKAKKQNAVPDDMIDVIKQQKLAQLRRRSSIRVPKGVKLIAPDRLEGLDNLPKGFRASTLAKNAEQGIGRLPKHLLPQVNTSGLAYRDLFYDNKKSPIRRRAVKSTVAFSIIDARNIPLAGPDVKILGRRVRMALFDKTNVMSNIHSVDAVYNPEFYTTWKFSTKASLLFPKDDENTCFLRVNDVDIRLSILFELCLIVESPKKDGDLAAGMLTFEDHCYQTQMSVNYQDIQEISCGWGLLPLFTADGGPIENKTYEIKLYGGTPFEKNVDLDIKPEKKSFLNNLISVSKTPRLNIRVWKLGKSAMSEMNLLPDVMVHFLAAVPVLSMYRKILAADLLGDQKETQKHSLQSTVEPGVTLVPHLLDSNDFARLLISVWDKKRRVMKSTDKRSFTKMRAAFTMVVYSLWPLLHVHQLPSYIPGDNSNYQTRQALIKSLQERGPIEFMSGLQSQLYFEPVSSDEVGFNYFDRALSVA